MSSQPQVASSLRIRWSLVILIVGILLPFSLAFLRTAWVSEDAFITFRVIDNALNGYGLTWNPGERVQAFTHPLWFGLLLPATAIFGDPYYVSLGASYALLLVSLVLLWNSVGESRLAPALMVASLLWSKAFVDYSSSGLENPLVYALLGAYVWAWLKVADAQRKTLALTAIAAALFLTRPDSLILVFPSLMAHLWQVRRALRQHLAPLLVGALPAVGWVAFSVFYYGAPVPNTAIAKVATGVGIEQRIVQAWNYIEWTLEADSFTSVLLVAGIILGFIRAGLRPLAFGLLGWMFYLFYVGADYMGGRFFSFAAFLAAALCAIALAKMRGPVPVVIVVVMLMLNIGILGKTVFASDRFAQDSIDPTGIADERGFYYQELGLIPVLKRGTWWAHPWLAEGRAVRTRPGLYTRCTIGMVGFAAGPSVRWLDPLALTDPFLARLPARTNARVGHYERAFPEGYLESESQGGNALADPSLRALYQDVAVATRAPLLNPERLGAIWRLNSGYHANAFQNFDRNAVGLPGIGRQSLDRFSCFGIPYGGVDIWKVDGVPARVTHVVVKFQH
jgi:arabinofuranosyltransferase